MDYLISYTKLIMYAWISQFLTQSSLRMHGLANFVHKAHYVCKIYFSIHVWFISLCMHGLTNFISLAHYICKIYFSIHVWFISLCMHWSH